jgi:hypothetical protein
MKDGVCFNMKRVAVLDPAQASNESWKQKISLVMMQSRKDNMR